MITALNIKNVRAFSAAHVDLAPLSVIVGPNASGKTTILECLYCLSTHLAGGVTLSDGEEYRKYFAALRRLGSSGSLDFALTVQDAKGTLNPRLSISNEYTDFRFPLARPVVWDFQTAADPGSPTVMETWQRLIASTYPAGFYRLNPRRIAMPSYVEGERPQISESGYGIPSMLADLLAVHPDAAQRLSEMIRKIVPSVRNVRAKRSPVANKRISMPAYDLGITVDTGYNVKQDLWGHEIVFDFEGATGVPASAAGDGTVLTVALLTILLYPTRPRIVLLDELERGLHPAALASLVTQLRAILVDFPDLQIVATSQSPYLVDQFGANEVFLTSVQREGSLIARLDSHPDAENWQKSMKSGELWSAVGEDWVAKGKRRPSRKPT